MPHTFVFSNQLNSSTHLFHHTVKYVKRHRTNTYYIQQKMNCRSLFSRANFDFVSLLDGHMSDFKLGQLNRSDKWSVRTYIFEKVLALNYMRHIFEYDDMTIMDDNKRTYEECSASYDKAYWVETSAWRYKKLWRQPKNGIYGITCNEWGKADSSAATLAFE